MKCKTGLWVCVLLVFPFLLAALPCAAWAQRLAVGAAIANVRSGPGTQYDVLWQVEKYYPFEVLKKESKWYYFKDFEGDRGWLHESLVKKSNRWLRPAVPVTSGPAPAPNMPRCSALSGAHPLKCWARRETGSRLNMRRATGDGSINPWSGRRPYERGLQAGKKWFMQKSDGPVDDLS